mmetsp:Transcript_15739/g.19188  ORF Transcript_15739/g.19188 Transcript_15739/m.19188 type:complete len:228 (-) Transcript_15739:992-1675(-)
MTRSHIRFKSWLSFLLHLGCLLSSFADAFLIISNHAFYRSVKPRPIGCGTKPAPPFNRNSVFQINGSFGKEASAPTMKEEEVLMKISLSIKEGYKDRIFLPLIQHYMTSFPFAAILPVQPLTYKPREDDMGVTVSFLRKKTQEKGSLDGGIEFKMSLNEIDESKQMEIVARRNSEGQVISKVFSEGMIIKAFVDSLSDECESKGKVGIGHDKVMEIFTVESIFHKWM